MPGTGNQSAQYVPSPSLKSPCCLTLRQEQETQNNWSELMPCQNQIVPLIYFTNTVVAADGLSKRDVFRLPDPFAVITVDGEQTHTTSVIKKTLNPYWNENFDM
jgi:Ca2+-dependent lipid-binding protein